eukprot:m.19674 g.19674  ORF g.19674 m.19674 type:complete len:532 (-) comp8725_c0_seq1:68-1663(-)
MVERRDQQPSALDVHSAEGKKSPSTQQEGHSAHGTTAVSQHGEHPPAEALPGDSQAQQQHPPRPSLARARWRHAGAAIRAAHRFKGIPALLPRADTSDRSFFPDTGMHRPVGWILGGTFLAILIAYIATLSYRDLRYADEGSFDFVAVHAFPIVMLIFLILHLVKAFIRASAALSNRIFNRYPMHLQTAFATMYILTCAYFFLFIWAFDLLWIRDYGQDASEVWLSQVVPIAIIFFAAVCVFDLLQRVNWAWAAVFHLVFLMTAPILFIDVALRYRFCENPANEHCLTSVVRIFGVMLWGEAFNFVLGIALVMYLTGCRTKTVRNALTAGLIIFVLSKIYLFAHSLVLFILDFALFATFFQVWYIVSISFLVLCYAFEVYVLLVLMGRLDILHEHISNTSGARYQDTRWPQKVSFAKLASRSHKSAYRTFLSQIQGYTFPLLISVWDDMVVSAESASRQHMATTPAGHDGADEPTLEARLPRSQERTSPIRPPQAQSDQPSSQRPAPRTTEELFAHLNGQRPETMYTASSL